MDRTLVVDDDGMSREFLQDLLGAAGYDVSAVGSAEDALDVIAAIAPDLIIMDIRLPGMDGLEATRRIKGDPITAQIPVIVTTAHAMKGDKERIMKAGCDACLVKPLRASRVLATMTAFLPVKSMGDCALPSNLSPSRIEIAHLPGQWGPPGRQLRACARLSSGGLDHKSIIWG